MIKLLTRAVTKWFKNLFTQKVRKRNLGKFGIEEVLLAMPSVGRARKKEIIESFDIGRCQNYGTARGNPTGGWSSSSFRYP